MQKYFLFLAAILLYTACKTLPPKPEKMPVSTLAFNRIEGKGIHQIVLFYHFETENPRAASMIMMIQNWKTTINGYEVNAQNAVLKSNGDVFSSIPLSVAPGKTIEMDFELYLDLNTYIQAAQNSPDKSPEFIEADEFITELRLEVSCQYGSTQPIIDYASATTKFPRIREPEFSIISIAIMQAELINTRFAVTLKIDNPNPFPVTLSSLKYELFGHGLFWADGNEQNVLAIPAKDSAQTRLFLIMNFINMKRGLLNEIIAMRRVNYRFTGEAQAGTTIPWLPQFSMKFDKSGYSEVFE